MDDTAPHRALEAAAGEPHVPRDVALVLDTLARLREARLISRGVVSSDGETLTVTAYAPPPATPARRAHIRDRVAAAIGDGIPVEIRFREVPP